MVVKSPRVLHDDATAPGDGVVVNNPEYKHATLRFDEATLEVRTTSGTPTFSIQPRQSIDGVSWNDVGGAISAVGVTNLTVRMPFFKAELVSVSGGGVTVTVA